MTAVHRSRILLLDTDALLTRALRRTLSSVADALAVTSCAAATRALRDGSRWVGFVVEATLPDGSGLDWLAAARASGRREPALVLASTCERAHVNRAFELRAGYLCKPFTRRALVSFVDDIAARDPSLAHQIPAGELASYLTHAYRLTPSEGEIVASAVRGMTRQELVAARGISMNTLKTQVRSALRKIRAGSLAEVRARVRKTWRLEAAEGELLS